MAIHESDWLTRHRLEFESVKFGAPQARQVDSPSLPRCARELVLVVLLFYQYNLSRLVASLSAQLITLVCAGLNATRVKTETSEVSTQEFPSISFHI